MRTPYASASPPQCPQRTASPLAPSPDLLCLLSAPSCCCLPSSALTSRPRSPGPWALTQLEFEPAAQQFGQRPYGHERQARSAFGVGQSCRKGAADRHLPRRLLSFTIYKGRCRRGGPTECGRTAPAAARPAGLGGALRQTAVVVALSPTASGQRAARPCRPSRPASSTRPTARAAAAARAELAGVDASPLGTDLPAAAAIPAGASSE